MSPKTGVRTTRLIFAYLLNPKSVMILAITNVRFVRWNILFSLLHQVNTPVTLNFDCDQSLTSGDKKM